jgi:hypothetical protein
LKGSKLSCDLLSEAPKSVFGMVGLSLGLRFQALKELRLPYDVFCKWYRQNLERCVEDLNPKNLNDRTFWRKVYKEIKKQVVL